MAALRLLYDVSFFIIVTTIGLNIVFGIIVDTFSELRDERVGHCSMYMCVCWFAYITQCTVTCACLYYICLCRELLLSLCMWI